MKVQKILEIFSIFLLIVILLLAGGVFGIQSGQAWTKQEEMSETITDIAVVNLDEGIYENNKKRFYSSELMDLEADNIVAENLEAARRGINNGSYAAYILIPAEFSADTVSINTTPHKTTLEFAINQNLRDDVSKLTMANIKNFEISLNTNMSYMYVQAILSEFHNVQDSASIIMSNDNAELARLLKINPQDLLANLEYTESKQISADVEAVGFRETFDNNMQVTEELKDNYDSFVSQGKTAFEEVKKEGKTVEAGLDSLYETMDDVDVEKNTSDKVVYEAGIGALDAYLKEYNTAFEEQKSRLEASIKLKDMEKTLTEPDTTMPELIERMIDNSLTEVNKRIESENKKNEEAIRKIENGIRDIRKIAGTVAVTANNYEPEETAEAVQKQKDIDTAQKTVGAEEKVEETETETETETEAETEMVISMEESAEKEFRLYAAEIPKSNDINDYLEKMEKALSEIKRVKTVSAEEVYCEDGVQNSLEEFLTEVENLPKVETKEYDDIFKLQVLKPLKTEIQEENKKIKEEGSKFRKAANTYSGKIESFDAYNYYDYEKMDNLLQSFDENTSNLEKQVTKSNDGYREYASDVYEQTSETIDTLKSNLVDAYQGTEENVQKEVDLAKQYRQEINTENINILSGFSQKLPYTRVGKLEYVQTYDFIVKPVQMSDSSVSGHKMSMAQNMEILKNILIGMIAAWCFLLCVMFFLKNRTVDRLVQNEE